MAQALPLLKLSALFIKTIAKPITSYMKKEAPKRPRFSKLCVGIGQGVHSMFSRLNVLASGYKFVGVKPLPVDEALVKGVEYLSEFMVISASTTIIMIEFTRGEKKNAIKAAQAAAKEDRIELSMQTRLACIEAGILGLERVLAQDRRTHERLENWRATEMDGEIQRILAMNNIKLAQEKADKPSDKAGQSGGGKGFVEQSLATADAAVANAVTLVQFVWGSVGALLEARPPQEQEKVALATGSDESAAASGGTDNGAQGESAQAR